tara:strand:- start:5976 stop:6281 length:306 start_codon:yes stop_codon:yes gene_type:complete
MERLNNRVSDKTSLNISLPMIIQIVGFITAMVWGYSQLTARISFIENESLRNTQAIGEMKALQDDPIPSDVKQDEILKFYDARLNSLEADIEYAKRKIYNK